MPGASVLVRVIKAASETESIPPPDYRTRQYLTNYYNSPDKDRELMAERLSDPAITLRDWIGRWKLLERANTSHADALVWAEHKMKATSTTPLFGHKFLDQYNISEGLEIYIEGFHNAARGSPMVTVCSFNPPGKYYASPRVVENVFGFDKVDLNSPQKSMCYGDELKLIRGINPYESWQVIFDIKGMIGTQIVDCGWSMISLFDRSHNGVYVNSGVYMVTLP